MELIFVRHGEAIHTLDPPESLDILHPYLTDKGILQAKDLRSTLPLSSNDIVVISPLKRTLETAMYWSDNTGCSLIANPMIAPRIFPQASKTRTLSCDKLMSRNDIMKEFPDVKIQEEIPENLWVEGINIISREEFFTVADQFLHWCMMLEKSRIYLLSHDGTITSYRELISGKKLSRKDFPEETDFFTLEI
ncbi:histidine phosphatase family protein [Alkalicoccus daliensis]|uniref:Broad specificity phosphatase PhoE n=1 Tax=Alkalicoccus daliensis TaxID=745820 RepID=A0A1H0CV23_9BACI|nr:histidine phosphatase family protein [Alkalicoccus daliensis]SDN61740.1 Broad specificity phosphatase PhoE [Alkalicoccus daliensis]